MQRFQLFRCFSGSLCFVSAVVLIFCVSLPATHGTYLGRQALYGAPSKEDILWKRLTDLLHDEPEGQTEIDAQGDFPYEARDIVSPANPNYRFPPVSHSKKAFLRHDNYYGVRTSHPIQFQPFPFQQLTSSTYCISNFFQFRPKLNLANGFLLVI